MKFYIKTLSVLILLAFFGCSDLEEDPKSILSPTGFFKSYQDVEANIMGVYGRMTSNVAWGGEWTQAIMLLSDNITVGRPSAAIQNFEIDEFKATPNHYYSRIIWSRGFEIINSTNTAIMGARQVDIEPDLKLRLEAEARAQRALIYFNLVRLFGDLPYFDEPVADIESALDINRNSEAEIYTKIIEDLDFAFVAGRLPNGFPSGAKTRITRGSVATILASVHLTLGNWQEAYESAKFVIDNKADFGYDLVTDFQDLYNADKQDGISEHIFAVDFLGLIRDSDNDDFLSPLTGEGYVFGWSIMVPSMEVYDDWDARDYRKDVSFDTTAFNKAWEPIHYTEFRYAKRPHIAKYTRFVGDSQSKGRRSDLNYPLYRYAEVLLIAAEALNEISGPTAEAQGYVNEIRTRARIWPDYVAEFPPDVDQAGLTADSFRDIVLEERRIELAFEYKRWFDIKRRNLGDQVFKGPNSLEPQPNFDGSKHYLLPIPQRELDVNPNLGQNTGY